MNYKTTFCIAIAFLAVVGATLFLVSEWNFKRDWASRVDEAVDQFSLKDGPGGVVGIVMDGELVYERAFGYADGKWMSCAASRQN